MSFQQTINCPICSGGTAELIVEEKTYQFRGEGFSINEHYYKCKSCGEEYHIETMLDFNLNQVYDQYYKKYPEQIRYETLYN